MKQLSCLILISTLLSCASSQRDDRLKSPFFKDGRFHNFAEPKSKKSFLKFLKMRWSTEYAKWPEWIDSAQISTLIEAPSPDQVKVTFINHASFLIQTHGLNILTDPIYSQRCSPVSFAGPKRVHRPAVAFEALPKIDLVIISHDHYDHLDLNTISKLVKRDNPKLLMGLGVARHLDSATNVTEMDWWQSTQPFDSIKVSFVPVQHFSGRTLFDRYASLWGGYVLEFGDKKIYFGGDSGYADHYRKTYDKFGAMDLAFLPIGAYAPRSFMEYAHMDPKQAVQAHLDLRSRQSIGMHYGTFQLTAEPINEPEELLAKERASKQVKDSEFVTLELGKSYIF